MRLVRAGVVEEALQGERKLLLQMGMRMGTKLEEEVHLDPGEEAEEEVAEAGRELLQQRLQWRERGAHRLRLREAVREEDLEEVERGRGGAEAQGEQLLQLVRRTAKEDLGLRKGSLSYLQAMEREMQPDLLMGRQARVRICRISPTSRNSK